MRSRPDVRRYFEGKPHMAQVGDRVLDPQVDFCFSEEPVPKVPEIPPKRWVCREVADACEALRDAEAKFERAPDGTIRIMKRPDFEKPPEYGSVEWVLQQPRGEPLPTNEVDPVAVGGVLALCVGALALCR